MQAREVDRLDLPVWEVCGACKHEGIPFLFDDEQWQSLGLRTETVTREDCFVIEATIVIRQGLLVPPHPLLQKCFRRRDLGQIKIT